MTIPTWTAHGGLELPVLGFGTYRLKGSDGADGVARAIEKGYRLIDSAFNYENEGTVGAGVRRAGIDRDEVIATSKLPGRHHAYDEALETIEESVFRSGLGDLDLYLIHWPNPKTDRYVEAWEALIEARERGLVKAIGVCNFLPEHLERLERETGVLPEVNQIEMHPYFPQEELLRFDAEHGILTEAWSPLGRGNDLLENEVIVDIARKHGATPGQTVLAWAIARVSIPIPKAASDERQLENLGALEVELDEDDIAAITALGRADGRLADQDPAEYEEF
ncbi:2,5-diketo-D-gluconic acid reductase [Microbacterium barkeri]|uniref:2,5-diketo-D-gluconic acid reductase n=1 Tax=Microbacterium barkeri TaxID=33917 RepID=A0A9W6LXS1_9MICO|nr:aldo/keto reductase [Microbacterium barkeri]MDR6875097.1 diketogulonate reductase-like aldo/keto reductase [Microbacterium barkeri]GLJ62786.1 2,5-diketo-D-gluconic acid reductase [Microbacterium barkeri]